MAEARAKLSYLRVAPRKARLVVDQIRGKAVVEAENILMFSERAVSKNILKLLKSAVANADLKGLDVDSLMVSEVWVDGGPIVKRYRPRAMGRASRIHKRTSHITLILCEEV